MPIIIPNDFHVQYMTILALARIITAVHVRSVGATRFAAADCSFLASRKDIERETKWSI